MKVVAFRNEHGHIVPVVTDGFEPNCKEGVHRPLVEQTPELKELVEAACDWERIGSDDSLNDLALTRRLESAIKGLKGGKHK